MTRSIALTLLLIINGCSHCNIADKHHMEFYHNNGSVSSKGDYIKGKQDGYWEFYYPNGKIYSKGKYKKGKKDGYWESYNSNGEMFFNGVYTKGKLASKKF